MIDSFRGYYRFLSNFYPSTVELYGYYFPTVENAYQAGKCSKESDFKSFLTINNPSEAKSLGKQIMIRNDWEVVKLMTMEYLLIQKFNIPEIRQLLMSTGNLKLIEGNNWGDTYWGVSGGLGSNHLGKLIMKIRDELNHPSQQP